MKKSTIIHILVIVVTVFLNYFIANILIEKQASIAKSRKDLSNAPIGGFNKFASDVHWMFFVNYCGSIKSVDDTNVEEVYQKLNGVLRNDPDFVKAYKIGGMMICVKAPVKAAEILMRGALNENLKENAEIPFLAGYVLSRNVKDSDDIDVLRQLLPNKENKLDRLFLADKMFLQAVQRSGGNKYHFFSSLLRNRAKIIQKRGTWKGNRKVYNREHAYLYAVFDEWKKSQSQELDTEDIAFHDTKGFLLNAIKSAQSSSPENPNIKKTVDMIVKRVFNKDKICSKCFSKYGPGHKFCSKCGNDVEVYGVCKCGALKGGNFCHSCGLNTNSRK